MYNNTAFVVVAIVAAMALLGVLVVLAVTTLPTQQQAEASPGCEKGLPRSAPAINASKGRCFR